MFRKSVPFRVMMPWKRVAKAAIITSATGRLAKLTCFRRDWNSCRRRCASAVSRDVHGSPVSIPALFRNASAAVSSPPKAGPNSIRLIGHTTSPSARLLCSQSVEAGSNCGSPVTRSSSTEVSTTHAMLSLAPRRAVHALLRLLFSTDSSPRIAAVPPPRAAGNRPTPQPSFQHQQPRHEPPEARPPRLSRSAHGRANGWCRSRR